MKQENQITFQNLKLLTTTLSCSDLIYQGKCSFTSNILSISFSSATVCQNWFPLAQIKPYHHSAGNRIIGLLPFCFILLFIRFEIRRIVWINCELYFDLEISVLQIRNAKDTIRRSYIYGAYTEVLKFKSCCTPQIYWKMYCN